MGGLGREAEEEEEEEKGHLSLVSFDFVPHGLLHPPTRNSEQCNATSEGEEEEEEEEEEVAFHI